MTHAAMITLRTVGDTQVIRVQRWVREILRLPAETEVQVHTRQDGACAIVVVVGTRRDTHVVRGALDELNWGSIAQDLLKLGPSCADSSS